MTRIALPMLYEMPFFTYYCCGKNMSDSAALDVSAVHPQGRVKVRKQEMPLLTKISINIM